MYFCFTRTTQRTDDTQTHAHTHFRNPRAHQRSPEKHMRTQICWGTEKHSKNKLWKGKYRTVRGITLFFRDGVRKNSEKVRKEQKKSERRLEVDVGKAQIAIAD